MINVELLEDLFGNRHDDNWDDWSHAYADFVVNSAIDGARTHPLIYAALGLAGEVGECVEHIKKSVRVWDDNQVATRERVQEERQSEFLDELSDVLWYVTRLADLHGLSLEELAERNMVKLIRKHKAKNGQS